MLKLCFAFLLFSLAFGAFVSIAIFAADVLRWHDKETKVKIKPSNDVKKIVDEILAESEVKENERDNRDVSESGDTEPGECDTPPVYGTWREP